jgi:hypothetical protein
MWLTLWPTAETYDESDWKLARSSIHITHSIVFSGRKISLGNAAAVEISARQAETFRPEQRPDDTGPVNPVKGGTGPEPIRTYCDAIVFSRAYPHIYVYMRR